MKFDRNDSVSGIECDVLIIGSGAAAWSAALTASVAGLQVLMVEKEETFGGASARSGGGVWIPNSRHGREAGVPDSPDAALAFFRHEAGDRASPKAIEAFVEHGPAMLDFVEAHSPVRFLHVGTLPDYHCDSPGGSQIGRSHYPRNWDAKPLGKELRRLRPALEVGTFMSMQVGTNETALYMTAGRKLKSFLHVARNVLIRIRDQFRAGRTLRLGSGNALIGGLAAACFERGVELWTSSPAIELVKDGKRVTGAIVDTPHGPTRVSARRGVILATGGFPHDSKRRAELFPAGATAPEVWGMLPYGNSGDGIRLGEAVGGKFNTRMLSPVALAPITRLHKGEGALQTFPCFQNRGKPGVIAVTRNGKRFTNEGRSYHDFSRALLATLGDEREAIAWLIFDHRYLRRWGNGPAFPWPVPYKQLLKTDYLKRGRTIRELAEAAGLNADNLEESVERYNRYAREGQDPDFNRGSNAYDIALGDPEHKPNPCIGPLDKAPFYAIRVYAGCVGTFAGLQADEHARVLDDNGDPIPGLYVIGNDMASITGGDYIAGGCTLGPGMTFGYLAARHMIQEAASPSPGSAAQDRIVPIGTEAR